MDFWHENYILTSAFIIQCYIIILTISTLMIYGNRIKSFVLVFLDDWCGDDQNMLIIWWLIWQRSEFVVILWSIWRWSKLVDILMFDMAAAFYRTPDGIHFTRQEGNQRTGQPSPQNKYNSKCIFQDGIHFIYEERGLPKNWTAPRTKQIQFKMFSMINFTS